MTLSALLLITGGDTAGEATSDVEVLGSCDSSMIPNLPWDRFAHTSNLDPAHRILVCGGSTSAEGSATTSCLHYDTSGTWETGSSLQEGRNYPASILMPAGLFVTGGYDEVGTDGRMEYVQCIRLRECVQVSV